MGGGGREADDDGAEITRGNPFDGLRRALGQLQNAAGIGQEGDTAGVRVTARVLRSMSCTPSSLSSCWI